MGEFLEAEKHRYVNYKATSPHLPKEARAPGVYKGKARPFCLPQHLSQFNLFAGIREDALTYFDEFNIKWHDGIDRTPSNHLCDSQVCCVNFLYSFSKDPDALGALLQPLYPDLLEMLPLEQADRYVSHEWIGQENYLGEKIHRHGKRSRGANFTSADAVVMFRRSDGSKRLVLIEWKYTETYSTVDLKIAKSGTDRTEIYRHLYDRDDFPLDKNNLPGFESLFYEPFYQLFRQQLLANEMERAGELGASVASLLHITPSRNRQFGRITSPSLSGLGGNVTDVWSNLMNIEDRFRSVSVEGLFGPFPVKEYPAMQAWWDYTASRYPWFVDASEN